MFIWLFTIVVITVYWILEDLAAREFIATMDKKLEKIKKNCEEDTHSLINEYEKIAEAITKE